MFATKIKIQSFAIVLVTTKSVNLSCEMFFFQVFRQILIFFEILNISI